MGPVRIPQDPQRGLEDSPGPYEIPGDTSGPRGVPQDPAGFFCPPPWTLNDSSGPRWIRQGVRRAPWVYTGFPKVLQSCQDSARGSVVCQILQRCFRTPQGFQGSPRSRRMPCESSLILAILRESPAGFGGSFELPGDSPGSSPVGSTQISFKDSSVFFWSPPGSIGIVRIPRDPSGAPGSPQ